MVARVRSTRRRIMRAFKINELSAVDKPAQHHATMTLMKRDDNDAGKNYGEIAEMVREVQAIDFDTVLAENEAREAACEVGNELREKWYALQRSFDTIAADDSVSAPEKITAMQNSLRQYINSLSEQSTDIAETMTKALSAAPALAELLTKDDTSEGDEEMPGIEKKQLDELQKQIDALTKKLEAATADDTAKKAADLQGELDKALAQVRELTEKAEAEAAEKAEALVKASMTDSEKAYMDGMDDKARKEFMAMSPADRKKKMQKAADEDPVVYKSEGTGEEFRKSDDPRLVKMAKQADEDRALAKAEREKRETTELTKRAGEVPYSYYTGEDAEKIEVLRAVSKMDEAPRKALEKMLETGGKAIGAAFEKIGHSDEKVRKTANDFNKRVEEIKERDKISSHEAMRKARAEYPEEFKAYQSAGQPAGAN